MIDRIRLVAAREFRQIAATKSFWVTLLIIPFSLGIGSLASSFRPDSRTLMLIDRAGIEAPAIRARLHFEDQRDVLAALSRYAQRHDLARTDPKAPWARPDRWYGDDLVAAFLAAGGERAALARMRPAMKPDTPAFQRPAPELAIVPTPPELAAASPAELDRLAPARLDPPKGSAMRKVDYILYVPPDFGAPGAAVRLWTNGQSAAQLMQSVQTVLTRDMRVRYLAAHGLDRATAEMAAVAAPPLIVRTPPIGQGQERVAIQSILPLAVAYMLFMSLMLSGQWMLQGLVEERSNKLLETVLACVSPSELMHGKLIGIVAVGFTMILFWIGCGAAAAYFTSGAIADLIRPAIAPLTSPGVALAMIYFFAAGYILMSMIFLAIGAMSDSFRDAQSYLTPVIMVVMMPFFFLASTVIRNPDSLFVRVMTWIPIYTPFTMLARLGQGVPVWEILGAGALLGAFLVVEFIALGRVFRQSLLNAGDKPNLARIGRMMRGWESE